MKRPHLVFALTALCCAAVFGPQRTIGSTPGVPKEPTYIVHVTVIDTETGAEVRDRTVVISNDRIVSVQDSTGTKVPPHATIVDGTGKYLIPGLWDMHVHLWDYPQVYPLLLANGVTGVRDMAGPPDANHFRAELAASAVRAPHFYLGSPLLDGPPQIWAVKSIQVNSPDEARQIVDQQKQRGADFIKVYDRLPRDSYYAIVEESGRVNIPFVGHVPDSISAREASAAKQKSIEHSTGIAFACSSREDELRPQLVKARTLKASDVLYQAAYASYSAEKCARLLTEFKINRTWQDPTLVAQRAWGNFTDEGFRADQRLRYFSGRFRNMLAGTLDVRSESEKVDVDPKELAESSNREYIFDQRLVGAMFRGGVPLLAGTDAGGFFSFPGFSLHDELALLVHSGVSPLAALQAATRNPAIFMNVTDKYGSVTAGKVADLVLLDADPLQDIHNTTKIAAVIIGGTILDRAAIDKMLRDAAEAALAEQRGSARSH